MYAKTLIFVLPLALAVAAHPTPLKRDGSGNSLLGRAGVPATLSTRVAVAARTPQQDDGDDGDDQDGQGQDGQDQGDQDGQDGQEQNGQDQDGQDQNGQDQDGQDQDGQDQDGQDGQDGGQQDGGQQQGGQQQGSQQGGQQQQQGGQQPGGQQQGGQQQAAPPASTPTPTATRAFPSIPVISGTGDSAALASFILAEAEATYAADPKVTAYITTISNRPVVQISSIGGAAVEAPTPVFTNAVVTVFAGQTINVAGVAAASSTSSASTAATPPAKKPNGAVSTRYQAGGLMTGLVTAIGAVGAGALLL